jgi:signal transduction histidine kinase
MGFARHYQPSRVGNYRIRHRSELAVRTTAPPAEGHRVNVIFGLKPDDEAPGMARERVARELRNWGLTELVGDALVVLSELVTNSVRYGATQITVNVEWLLRGGVEVAVWDDAPGVPQKKEPDFVSETGRGLHVVEGLAVEWGHHPGLGEVGKVVWAVIRG